MDASGRRPETPQAGSQILTGRTVSGAIWMAIEMASTQIISLLVFAIMARFVSPGDFGLISISYLAIFAFKSIIIDTVIFEVIRKKDASNLEYTTCFWLTIAFSVIGAISIFFSAGPLEQLMRAPHLKDVLREMSVIVLFMGLARTHEMRLFRLFHFRALAVRGVLGAVLGGAIGVALAVQDFGLTALVAQQVATSVISLAILWISASWTPSFNFSGNTLIDILKLMRTLVPTCFLGAVTNQCDTFLVGYMFGTTYAGLYALAKRLRFALQAVALAPINGVAFSTLAECQDDRIRLKAVSVQAVALIAFFCAPIFFGASSIAREVIVLGFGDRWAAAAPIFAIYTIGGVFASLQSFGDTIFTIKHRQIWTLYNLLLFTAIAASSFWLIRDPGEGYVAVPFIVPFALTLPISAVLASRLVGLALRQWVAAVYPPLISSLIMFVLVRLLSSRLEFLGDLPRALMCVAVGLVIYLSLMLVLGRRTVVFALNAVWKLAPATIRTRLAV